jgi:non-ribosomal peptide synthetase component F
MAMRPGVSHWIAETDGLPLREITLGGLLREQAARHPDRPAIIFDEVDPALQARWSYGELDSRVDAVAKALMAIGVAHGDRVAVMSPIRASPYSSSTHSGRFGDMTATRSP